MPRKPRRTFCGSGDHIAAFLRECEGDRERCRKSLSFFLPVDPTLRTAEALQELIDEFDPPQWARARRELEGGR